MIAFSRSQPARFIDIDMPAAFVLEVQTKQGGWVDRGLYRSDAFAREPDGTYVCSGHGSPLFLRCVRQQGELIDVIDGEGTSFTYRLVPLSERALPSNLTLSLSMDAARASLAQPLPRRAA